MSKKHSKEQALVPLNTETSLQSEDPVVVALDNSIKINLAKLTAPANVYDADIAWIKHRTGVLSLFFAKNNLSTKDTFRTRLEVRFPPENLVQFWENSKDFAAKLYEYVKKWPEDIERRQINPAQWLADKDHSEWANFGTMAHSGSEAAFDFYTLSPTGIAKYIMGQGTSQLNVQSVVRIQMTVFELSFLLENVAETVSQIKEYLPREPEMDRSTEKV
jgi:hypothetical protein